MHTNQLQLLDKLAKSIKAEKKDPVQAIATLKKAKILNNNGQFTKNYKHLEILVKKK